MGMTYANITLRNPREIQLVPMEVQALVDTGAFFLCIPEHIAHQLNLSELEKREVEVADGTRKKVPYVGPLQITFVTENKQQRNCFGGALVLGNQVLLGVIPMEDMDLLQKKQIQKIREEVFNKTNKDRSK